MAKPHYIVSRSRSGRYNFTLITSLGRIMGYVEVGTNGLKTAEILQEAHLKIRDVADELLIIANHGEQEDERASVIASSNGERQRPGVEPASHDNI